MPGRRDKPSEPGLMRNLGEFFGHIAKAIREDPDAPPPPPTDAAAGDAGSESDPLRREVRREVHEARQGEFLLRRTMIDEVIHDPDGRHEDERATRVDPPKHPSN